MATPPRKIDFSKETPTQLQPPAQPFAYNGNHATTNRVGNQQFINDYRSQIPVSTNPYVKLNARRVPEFTPSPRTVGGFDYYGYDGKGNHNDPLRKQRSHRGGRRHRSPSSNATVTAALENISLASDGTSGILGATEKKKGEEARPKHLHPREVRKLRGDMLISEMESFANLLSEDYLDSRNNSRPQSSSDQPSITNNVNGQRSGGRNSLSHGAGVGGDGLARVLHKHLVLSGVSNGHGFGPSPQTTVPRPPANTPRMPTNNKTGATSPNIQSRSLSSTNLKGESNHRPQTATIVNHIQGVQKRIDDALADLVGTDEDEADSLRGPSRGNGRQKSRSPSHHRGTSPPIGGEQQETSPTITSSTKGLSARMRTRNTTNKGAQIDEELVNATHQQMQQDRAHLKFVPTSPRGLAARPPPPVPLGGYRLPFVAPSSSSISTNPLTGPSSGQTGASFLTSRASGQLLQTASATLHLVGDMPRMGKSDNPTLNALKRAFLGQHPSEASVSPRSVTNNKSQTTMAQPISAQYGLVDTPLVINHFKINEGTIRTLDLDMDGNSKRISTRKIAAEGFGSARESQRRVAETTRRAQEALLGPFGLLPKDQGLTPRPSYTIPHQTMSPSPISPHVQPLFASTNGGGGGPLGTVSATDPSAWHQHGSLLATALRSAHNAHGQQHQRDDNDSALQIPPPPQQVSASSPPFKRKSLLSGTTTLSKPVMGSPAAMALIASLTIAVNEEQGRDCDSLVPLDPSVEAAILGTLPAPLDAKEAAVSNPEWADAAEAMRAVVQTTAMLPDHTAAMRLRGEHERTVLEGLRVQRAANGQIWSLREAPTALAQVSVATNILANGGGGTKK